MNNGNPYVLGLGEIDATKHAIAGGKGANLGELSRIETIRVPDGFCLTTEAFKKTIGENSAVHQLLDRLSLLGTDDQDKIGALGAALRKTIEEIVIPGDIVAAIDRRLSLPGEAIAYAVRSSATAEDLPQASFAGQQDTYLNVTGRQEVLRHISKCWASLFTDRAIIYRLQNGLDHRKVLLSVVVQQMVFPQTAGVLFTADPVTGNRKVSSVDASFGLGEAIVSGLVNADNYKVVNGQITNKRISAKKLAIYALSAGGTQQQDIALEKQGSQALTDEQVIQLEHIGRKIEAHFGRPQDIEWCLAGDAFYIVQSRPITTLYPIPETNDQENHVYVSTGHQQMMTDAMKPLGISLWQLTAGRPMFQAGGRLFVDVADMLATPSGRTLIIDVLGKSDPLIKDALTTVLERGDFIRSLPDDIPEQHSGQGQQGPGLRDFQTLTEYDPAVVDELINSSQASVAALQQDIWAYSGPALIDFIIADKQQLRKSSSDPRSFGVIMTGMNASSWINEKMHEWLGEKNAADVLSQSVPNNITSEMGLELLDVADAIRPYPEVIACLQKTKEDHFSEALVQVKGGLEVWDVIDRFLNKYGMRCAGEIDITRTRWREKPAMIIPIILTNIRNFAPGESKRRFEQGLREALSKEQELLDRLQQLPDSAEKVKETQRMIALVRNFIGYREYPKYGIVSRYFIYKQALLQEAEKLMQAAVIREKEDIYYLTFEELREVLDTHKPDYEIINSRKEDYKLFERLTPPRVITSDGEIITGKYKQEKLPANAIAGLAVSSGIIEGRARVILNMEDAVIEEGDILVTTFTDPSWTPLFVSLKGLITEVGGLMTHGAVIAREYGLPAVVGIENATRLIKDGQRIRVHGTDGYVEIL